jgi:hypothetical protein
MIDQNLAHEAGGDAEEVSPVSESRRLALKKPEVGFVDQSGGL